MEARGNPFYTSSMANTWKVVEKMMHRHHCELRLDVFLGVTGERWTASFYSPRKCQRYEARGNSAPLAICRAAKEAYQNLEGEGCK